MRQPARDDDARHGDAGFTLVELLVASLALALLFAAALTALDTGNGSFAKSSSRVDSAQRGRAALERVVRVLRSTVCASDGSPAFVAATPTSFTAYTDFSGGTEDTSDANRAGRVRPPNRTTVALTGGRLEESTQAARYASTTTSSVTYGTATTRVLATDVRAITGKPVFAYAVYDGGGTGAVSPLVSSAPGEDDRTRIVRSTTTFAVGSTIGTAATRAADLELTEDVTIGALDLNEELPVPVCSL